MMNEEIVLRAMTELFINRDTSAIERYWGTPYVQHDPDLPDGKTRWVTWLNNCPQILSTSQG